MRAHWLLLSALLVLSACGSDGGGSGTPPPTPNPVTVAPSGLTYTSPPVFVVGQPITAMTPSVSGSVTSYSVSPALPAGLSLNTTSGAISGTPSQVTASAAYTVTATNSGGSTTATITIVVNDASPVVVYEATSLTFTTGVPVTVAPTSSGGAVVSWAIAPALPEGLSFNATNGTITGTPVSASAEASYAITAQNSGGTATVNLAISVDSGVLLNLGHVGGIQRIRADGTRVVSIDKRTHYLGDQGHWALWNSQTNAIVAQGDVTCMTASRCASFADLAGPSLVVQTADTLQLRAASDGHVVVTITDPVSWWELAADGSYVAIGNTTELKVWSSGGTLLFSRAGDYSQADAFGAAAELRVAKGAVATTALEAISIPSGTSSTGPTFQGQFHSWFLDGERFLTNVGNTVWVYSEDGAQQDFQALPSTNRLTGQGNWFWVHDTNAVSLNIYPIEPSTSSPAATYTLSSSDVPVPSRNTIALLKNVPDPDVSIVDLSGASPAIAAQPLPPNVSGASGGTYAVGSQGERIIANTNGVLADVTVTGSPKFYGYGAAYSIAAGQGRIAVATALGVVVYFDSATRTKQGELPLFTRQIQLSADGTVLGAAIDSPRSVRLISLPSGTVIRSFTYSAPNVRSMEEFSLSASGTVLSRILGVDTSIGPWEYDRAVVPADGGAPIFADTVSAKAPLRLSPDGTAVAVVSGPADANATTNILINGTLTTAVTGWASGWLDNDRLLVNRFDWGRFSTIRFTGAVVVNRAGQETPSPQTDARRILQPIDSNRFYADNNQIYSVSTGEVLWSSPNEFGYIGAVTPDHVIFASGATIRAEAY